VLTIYTTIIEGSLTRCTGELVVNGVAAFECYVQWGITEKVGDLVY
jgi:hypothetical protein